MPTTDIEVCPQVHDAGTSINVDAAKDDQYTGLRRVAGPIPWLLFLICVVEVWPPSLHREIHSILILTLLSVW